MYPLKLYIRIVFQGKYYNNCLIIMNSIFDLKIYKLFIYLIIIITVIIIIFINLI